MINIREVAEDEVEAAEESLRRFLTKDITQKALKYSSANKNRGCNKMAVARKPKTTALQQQNTNTSTTTVNPNNSRKPKSTTALQLQHNYRTTTTTKTVTVEQPKTKVIAQ